MVLACTHFPLVADELARAFGPGVAFVDGAQGIARRIAHLTQGQSFQRGLPDFALFTRAGPDVEALAAALARFGLASASVF